MRGLKTAIVTGGAQGIGACVAENLAASGRGLLLVDLDEERLDATCRRLSGTDAVVHGVHVDLLDPSAPEAVMNASMRFFDGADELVNSAGTVEYGEFHSFPLSKVRELLTIHVEATFAMTQAFVRERTASGRGGSIVNIGSMHALRGVGGTSGYAAAKGAIHAMSRTLAVELAPLGIRVNTVALGATGTARLKRELAADVLERRLRQVPLGRLATPEEAAGAVRFLLDNGYVTGTELIVDGGFTAFGDH